MALQSRSPALAGAAGAEASTLKAHGYPVVAVGNARRNDYAASIVMYRPGYNREAGRLAHAIAAIAAMLDPALVVLGGGVGDNADLLLEPVYAALSALTPLRPPIVPSALGGDAVLIGAIATALTTARDLVFEGRL